ncbi:hypothetical protein [Auritidibacter ignavus]|uniref:hypothetical protein n=1 Tax=Auritidibacter ignavus TaxID=678932 RepID=UPI002FE62F8D
MEWITLINIVIAAFSLGFTVFSWYWANKSKAARTKAEEAAQQTERKIAAAENTANELRQMVKTLQGPPLKAVTHKPNNGATTIGIINTTNEDLTLTKVINSEEFVRLDGEENLPITLHPGQQHQFQALGAYGYPVPANLHLRYLQHGQEQTQNVALHATN